MRKIGIVGGTGIENPDTLKGLKRKSLKRLMAKHCATSAR